MTRRHILKTVLRTFPRERIIAGHCCLAGLSIRNVLIDVGKRHEWIISLSKRDKIKRDKLTQALSFSEKVFKEMIEHAKEKIKNLKTWKILLGTYGGIRKSDECYFTICVIAYD